MNVDHLNDTLLFYFLSTVAQTLFAVVAFIGLVAVWRLQQIDWERRAARDTLIEILRTPDP